MLLIDDIAVTSPGAGSVSITIENISGKSQKLSGLEPATSYIVSVKGDFGTDGESEWTSCSFTTKTGTENPVDLAATDVTPTSATLKWTGYQDSYNVQYRTAKVKEDRYFYNFNDGYDAAHNEGWNWDGNIIYGISDPIYGFSGSENYFLQMGWASTDEATIVSPELPEYESGLCVEFYYFGYSTANTFQVGYSSTTNDLEAFTWSDPIDVPLQEYTLFDDELPAGTKYVAFKATASDQSAAVFIDDFKIYKLLTPAGKWTSATVNEPTLTLAGLTPGTGYEWQVQGNLTSGTTEWSTLATFTTPIMGDANGDGQVTLADAVAVVNYILGKPSPGFSVGGADMNNNKKVTISDAVAIVNYVLSSAGGK